MPLITVGCKLPQGLIIEVGYKVVPGGVMRGADYKRLRLRGANMHHVAGAMAPADLAPGLTHNVDEAFFDAWVKSHIDTNIVKNKLVFKSVDKVEAEAQALDVTEQKTGLEPIDPKKAEGVKPRTDSDDDK